MNSDSQAADFAESQFRVRKVSAAQPLTWIRDGWEDLNHHRGASLAHGFLITGLGFVILLFASTHIYFTAAAISGFLLIGPIMATGLCELSRRRGQGEPTGFDESLDALSRNRKALWHFAVTLLGFSLVWFVVSGLIMQALPGPAAPTIGQTLWGDFLNILTPRQVMLYMAVGGILALLVFVLSVISIPAIVDRPVSALTAMRMSARVFSANLPAMLVWGILIVVLTAIGFMTFLLGMILIYPLLGHATWYAYRDLIQ